MASRLSAVMVRLQTLNAITDDEHLRIHLKADVARLRRRARFLNSGILIFARRALCNSASRDRHNQLRRQPSAGGVVPSLLFLEVTGGGDSTREATSLFIEQTHERSGRLCAGRKTPTASNFVSMIPAKRAGHAADKRSYEQRECSEKRECRCCSALRIRPFALIGLRRSRFAHSVLAPIAARRPVLAELFRPSTSVGASSYVFLQRHGSPLGDATRHVEADQRRSAGAHTL
jgi:hypothetical protein